MWLWPCWQSTFALLLSRRLRGLISRLFTWRLLAPLAPMWERVSDAFNAYRFKYGALALAFGVALVGIACTSAVNWCLSQSMGGQMSLPVILLFNPLIALVLMVPISIGGIGVSQTAYPFFYGLAGVPAAHALAVSLLMQAVMIVASLPGGVFWLMWKRQRPATERNQLDTSTLTRGDSSWLTESHRAGRLALLPLKTAAADTTSTTCCACTALAERIAAAEGADGAVVRTAALLHDIGESEERENHHLRGAAAGAGTPSGATGDVRRGRRARHRGAPLPRRPAPQTLEAQVLSDADKLDAIGAIGIGRAYAFGEAAGTALWKLPWPRSQRQGGTPRARPMTWAAITPRPRVRLQAGPHPRPAVHADGPRDCRGPASLHARVLRAVGPGGGGNSLSRRKQTALLLTPGRTYARLRRSKDAGERCSPQQKHIKRSEIHWLLASVSLVVVSV